MLNQGTVLYLLFMLQRFTNLPLFLVFLIINHLTVNTTMKIARFFLPLYAFISILSELN